MTQFLIRILIFNVTLSLFSVVYGDSINDYSGIWEDSEGIRYSINQNLDSIAVVEFSSENMDIDAFEPNSSEWTNHELDLMSVGAGFFVLELNNGSYIYTRSGEFSVAENGSIVNKRGELLVTEKRKLLPASIAIGWNERAESKVKALSECGLTHDCMLEQYNKNEIFVSYGGKISFLDKDTGAPIEFDQIVLASIYPKDIKAIGDHYISLNPAAVDYFQPEQTFFHSGIQQGVLENSPVLDRPVWRAYSGLLQEGEAVLEPYSEVENEQENGKEIYFNSESTAIMNNKCPHELAFLCHEEKFTEKNLTKIF